MAFYQPSSPMLKAQRQTRRKLCSRLLYALFVVISSFWFVRYVLLSEGPSMDTAGKIFAAPSPRIASSQMLSPTRLLSNTVSPASPPVIPGLVQHIHTSIGPHTRTLGAILPITSDTWHHIDVHLRMLLDYADTLTEIVLVAPTHYHAKTRHALQAALTREDEADIEIRITPWPVSADQDAAILRAAQTLSTDWVLLLDEIGLRQFGETTRDVLLLRGERPMTAPLGPRGIDYYLDGITCITPSAEPRRAAYLVPPMVIPTAFLLQEVDYASGTDHWAALGDSVSRSGLDLSGGLVVGSLEDSSLDWCSRYAPTGLDGSPMPVHIIDERMQVATELAVLADQKDESHNESLGVILVVAHLVDLQYLSPIACGLQKEGHRVRVLIPDGRGAADDLGCTLLIEFLPEAIKGQLSLDVLAHTLPEPLTVVLSVTETSFLQLHLFLAAHRPSATYIQVPRADLPYTDWMTSLTMNEWKNWHVPQIELSVITNDRPRSLRRLLSSLDNARYFGDKLDMRVNLEKSADPETLRIVGGYAWERGSVFLHHRIVHGGLLPAVVESWYPRGNDSYGLILEDDVELSPLFYAYLKLTLLRYRYGRPEDRSPHLFGISLYQQKNLELRPEGRHLFDARALFAAAALPHAHTPYLSQIPCSWGALYFPEHWREFHAYLSARLAEHVWPLPQTVVPGVRSNRWTRSWKRYFIELVFLRGYVMLYPNYAAHASLSTNHLEVGSHVRDVPTDAYLRKKRLFNVPLMALPAAPEDGAGVATTGLLELPDEHFPAWAALPVLDLLGAIVDQETILKRGAERRVELTGCENPPVELYDTDELLCIR